MDKMGILSDAVRVVSQLREDAQKLRESTENLQGKINELKVSMVLGIHILIMHEAELYL